MVQLYGDSGAVSAVCLLSALLAVFIIITAQHGVYHVGVGTGSGLQFNCLREVLVYIRKETK